MISMKVIIIIIIIISVVCVCVWERERYSVARCYMQAHHENSAEHITVQFREFLVSTEPADLWRMAPLMPHTCCQQLQMISPVTYLRNVTSFTPQGCGTMHTCSTDAVGDCRHGVITITYRTSQHYSRYFLQPSQSESPLATRTVTI
jgi:hypothetical protein